MPLLAAGALAVVAAMASGGEPAAGDLERRTFTSAGVGELPYRIRVPEVAAGVRLPLMLCLHGAGERGTDNAKHLGYFRPLFSGENARRFPAVVVLPQVPGGQLWASYGWGTKTRDMAPEPGPHLRMARALVDELLQQLPIDPARIYVVGLSMGGFGTWEFAQRWPELPAAIVPVCGGGDPAHAARIAAIPTWTFHGTKDGVVGYENSTRTVAALEAAGGKPKFTTYAGMGHTSWVAAFAEPELLPWLFAQRRPGTASR